MKYEISKDRKNLTITIDKYGQKTLYKLGEDISSDQTMRDFFEILICSSELQWIAPEETGDLTAAPMLGIRDGETVVERWAFMDYQVRSVLQDLRDNGCPHLWPSMRYARRHGHRKGVQSQSH